MEELVKYLGNFHPVILHLPIGAFLFTFLLFISQKYLKTNFEAAIKLGLLFSFITSIITSIFGFILRTNGEYDKFLVDRHMWLAIITTLLIGLVLYLHKKQMSNNYILSSFILSTLFLTLTGHNGGTLTHGKDYLKLPEFTSEVRLVNYDSIHVFNNVISSILDSKCVKCHNPSKSKGKLMLTSIEKILIGGEKGDIIKANSVYESRLYTYLNLPLNDKMHMPPDGNIQLTENEKDLIKYWIEKGADFYNYKKISDDSYSKAILNYLPSEKLIVDPPKKNDLIKLIEKDFRLERFGNNSNFIDVKYLGKRISQKDFNFLSRIKKNVKRLDFSGIDLSSISLNGLKLYENLAYLNLNNSSINFDILYKNIPASVKTLIISNNILSVNDFEKLITNPNLKRVFAYNTLVDNDEINLITTSSNNRVYFGVSLDDFASNVPLKIPEFKFESQTLFTDSLKIDLIRDISNPIYRYTLNGKDPDSLSEIFNSYFKIDETSTIKVKAFKKGSKSSPVKEVKFIKVVELIKDIKLLSKPVEPYTGDNILTDNVLGTNDFRDGKWFGFLKSTPNNSSNNSVGDLIAEFSLPNNVKEIGVSCLTEYGSYIQFPSKIQLYDISNGDEKLVYERKIKKSINQQNAPKFIFKIPIDNEVSRVKLKVISNKQLPKDHPAEGEPAWLFIDEILLF
jgi:uncharacterized membrane protein